MKNNTIWWILGIIIIIVVGLLCFNKYLSKRAFDKEAYLEYNYTDDEMKSFANIAFPTGRINKWHDDIQVEIADIDSLSVEHIAEVDSVIAIIAPLISPLKIERVAENGNLIVHRKVEVTPLPGKLSINPELKSYTIKRVDIYEVKYHEGTHELFRLFLNSLGLGLWEQPLDYCSVLMNYKLSGNTVSEEERAEFKEQRFPLAEIEKKMIEMLYNPEIYSGLPQSFYMERLGLKDKLK